MKTSLIQLLLVAVVAVSLFMLWSCTSQRDAAKTITKPVSFVVTPDWARNAVIYEVNTRQFTKEGTFDAFAAHLPRLKDLGVDILWFMPIQPIGELNRKGTLGSYYSIRDYKAVNPEFGSLDDFKNVVKKAHEAGFKVILDWVANHTAFDHIWIKEHPEWYNRDENDNIISPYDWTDVADLNYDDNPALWDAMIEAMKFWLTETDIDGFRCDVAGMVPTAFWEKARKELDAIKPVFMLAEDEGQRDLMVNAFDANYGWEFHHIMNSVAKGEKNVTDIWKYFAKEDSLFPPSSFRMMMTSNHDENSWNGTEFERLGKGAKAFAVVTYTIPGFPLIYNGQEVALDKRLQFFEKDAIDWEKASDFTNFYRHLNELKKSNECLWNASNGGSFTPIKTDLPAEVLSFVREKNGNRLLVFVNLTDREQTIHFEDKEIAGSFTDQFSGLTVEIAENQPLILPAWGYLILK